MSAEGLTQAEVDLCAKQARADGFTVTQGSPTTLLLDLDTPEACEQYERVLPLVLRYFEAKDVTRWRSKSGNTHVQITLAKEWDITTRLVLQAALGSDGKKEVLTLLRVWAGCKEPSLLFQPQKPVDADVRAGEMPALLRKQAN